MSLKRALLLFVLCLGAYTVTSTGRVHVPDEASALFQARALVEDGALVVPGATPGFEFYGRRDRWGQPRAPNGPAQAWALTPFYLLGKAFTRAPGVPSRAADLVIAFGVVLSSAVFAALAVGLFCLLLERRGVPPRAAVGASLALAAGTPLLAYAGYLFSEPLAAALLVAATLAAFGGQGTISTGRAALAGALLGLALLVRPAHAVATPVFSLALLARDGRRGLRSLGVLLALAASTLAGYALWDVYLFGDLLTFGYPGTAEGGKRLNTFETPILRGLWGFLFSPGKSIFLFAPIVLLGLASLARLFRRDRGLAVLAGGVPLAYLLLYARYTQWEGGYSFGPRYLVPVIPLLLLGLGPLFERTSPAGRRLAVTLIVLGALVQSVGLATSFLEDQRGGGYYDERFDYRMEHAPVISQGALLARHVAATLRGEPPAPLGKGFDRWFVFLYKAGVAWPVMAGPLVVALGGAAAAGAGLAAAAGALGRAGAPGARPGSA